MLFGAARLLGSLRVEPDCAELPAFVIFTAFQSQYRLTHPDILLNNPIEGTAIQKLIRPLGHVPGEGIKIFTTVLFFLAETFRLNLFQMGNTFDLYGHAEEMQGHQLLSRIPGWSPFLEKSGKSFNPLFRIPARRTDGRQLFRHFIGKDRV